jgi:hypothetical protein
MFFQHTPAAADADDETRSEPKTEEEKKESAGDRTPIRYYYNSKTKESYWERPPGCDISQLSASTEPLSWEKIRGQDGTATEWYVVITDGGGRFFCNRERGESHWVMPDEVAALLDPSKHGGAAAAAAAGGAGNSEGLGFYRAVAAAAVRAEFALDSDSVGVLGVGDVIEALEAKRNDAGIMRVRFEHGWTSLVARNGTTLLVKEGGGSSASAGQGREGEDEAAAKEPAAKLTGNEAKLARISAFKAMLEEYGVPAFGSWETELPKFVGDKR